MLLKPRHHMAAHPVILALAIALIAPAASQAAPLGGAFQTIAGGCGQPGSPVGEAHPNVLVRMQIAEGSPAWAAPGANPQSMVPGQVAWAHGQALAPGQPPALGFVDPCPGDLSYSAEFYDTPDLPITLTGTGASSVVGTSPGQGLGETYVPFRLKAAVPVAVDASVVAGGVQLAPSTSNLHRPPRARGFLPGPLTVDPATPGTLTLGPIAAGAGGLTLRALSGPMPQWSVTIRPLPVTVTASVALNISSRRHPFPTSLPGGVGTVVRDRADFGFKATLDGDTALSAVITDAHGHQVRSLAAGRASTVGDQMLPWDGKGDGGDPVPDGTYTATFTSHDAYGGSSVASVPLALDTAGPTVALTPPASSSEPLSIAAADAVSGVQSLRLVVAANSAVPTAFVGPRAITRQHPDATVEITPRDLGFHERWPSRFSYRLEATDGVSQRTLQTGTIVIPQAARSAVVRRWMRRTVVRRRGGRRGFRPIGRQVVLGDGNGGSLTAAVGIRRGTPNGRGQLVFFFHGDRFVGWDAPTAHARIAGLAIAGAGEVRVTYDRYRHGDRACCPSLRRKAVRFRWNGTRMVATSRPPSDPGRPVRVRLLPG